MLLNKIKNILVISIAVSLVGCASSPDIKEELSINEGDPALARLAASAENIQRQWNDIAAMESALYKKNHSNMSVGFKSDAVPGLQRLISLGDEWTGPVEPLVREVAGLTDYGIRVLGVKPAADVLVSVDTSYRRAIDILADAGYQSGKRAVIRILARDKIVEVEYARY
ncbi:MAG: DotD/TraH family lipoprotein [Methylococcales bacterium]